MTSRSPFFVVDNLLSNSECINIIDALNITTPDIDPEGKPLMSVRANEESELIIYNKLMNPGLYGAICQYYGIQYHATETMLFEFYPEGFENSVHVCENSRFNEDLKKWVRLYRRDVTGVLFLSDYVDPSTQYLHRDDFEVYGGKLEFPQYDFGFFPTRGTVVFYPSDPHFLNAVAPVRAGDSYQVRIHIAAKTPYLYDPSEFPGEYKDWF